MNFKKRFFMGALLLSLTLILSCKIGMGSEIDLEAPKITVTSPAKLSNQHLQFRMEGTCSDNKAVTSVVISNVETGYIYGYADIDGQNWTIDLSLKKEEEGEISFLCTANDAQGNTSTKSSKIMQLLIDETAPEGLSWYLDRGNAIQTPLYEKSTLEALDFNLSVNKDIPQNEKFTVYGRMYDAMSIKKVTLYLNDESGNVVLSKTVDAETIEESKSIYTPEFTFTHDELVAKDSKYKSGKHYFKLSYYSIDNHNNEKTRELDWMLWYPESDKPGIQQSITKNNKLSVSVNDSIPIDFFDDDGLKEVHYALKFPKNVTHTVDEYNSNASYRNAVFSTMEKNDELGVKEASGTDSYVTNASNRKRDVPYTIDAPSYPIELKLIACALDINNKWNTRIIDVEVTDNDKPLLFIEKPTENTIPAIKEGTDSSFEITGYSLDTKGSKIVKIVYIPETEDCKENKDKETKAKQILNSDSSTDEKTKLATGEVIWRKVLGSGKAESGWIKQGFTFEFDLLKDFNVAGKKDKFFEIQLIDTDNNSIFRQFKVSGDQTLPEIKLTKPAENMKVIDYSTEDLEIIFKGYKESGLAMKDESYSLKLEDTTYTIGNGGLKKNADGTLTFVMKKEDVATLAETNKQPTIYFTAEDVFENVGTDNITVVLSPLPHITAITSDKAEGTYKKGDVLTFQVGFSGNVKVTGTPKLNIFYSASDITDNTKAKTAAYVRGSGSNTLTFQYTVPENAVSTTGICCSYTNPIVLGTGTIKTDEVGEGDAHIEKVETGKNLQDSKEIKIDGVLPYIESIEIKGNVTKKNSKYYLSKDKLITAELTTNENVLISGTPSLVLKVGTSNLVLNFQKIDGKKLTFVHKVSSLTGEGAVSSNPSKYFSAADVAKISDVAGNTMYLKTGSDVTSAVVVDKTPPAAAPAISVRAGSYNQAQTLTLSGYEDGATLEYSKDGGVTWNEYTEAVTLQSGSYELTTRQYDMAGNVSPLLSTVKVEVNDTFPKPTSFTVKKANGNYAKDTVIPFTMTFDRTIFATTAGDIKIIMVPNGKTSPEREISSVATSSTGSTAIAFNYTVTDEDEFYGIQIKDVIFTANVVDSYGNGPSAATKTDLGTLFAKEGDGNRPGVILDGISPTVSSYSPVNNGINTAANDAFKITLTFNEKVYKESGNVILQRKGKWAIPAVISAEEFTEIYNNNSLTAAQKEALKLTEAGNGTGTDRLNARTGLEVGPYRRNTHGLDVSGANAVPDIQTKYVLDFNLGLYEGGTKLDEHAADGGKTVSVAMIRNALEATGYHQHVLDINSNKIVITDNVMEITFPDTIADGIEWELLIDDGALRDATGNTFEGIESGAYTLWSNKVSTPVVRVDRYSHGWGAKQPNAQGTLTEITGYQYPQSKGNLSTVTVSTTNSGRTIKPSGYARVRIDCQTPGATIYYNQQNSGSANMSSYRYSYNISTSDWDSHGNETDTYKSTTANIASSALTGSFTGTEYSKYLIIGDGLITTSRKDYVKAYATKSGMTKSANGYEGIFKTVIYSYRDTLRNESTGWQTQKNHSDYQINAEGGTAEGGRPIVSGFPLRDATNDIRYSKTQYYNNGTGGDKCYVWVSYEIVSDFAYLQHRTNYSSKYPKHSFGEFMYLFEYSTWE